MKYKIILQSLKVEKLFFRTENIKGKIYSNTGHMKSSHIDDLTFNHKNHSTFNSF